MLSGEVEVTGVGYGPSGHFGIDGHRIDVRNREDLLALLESGLRCNHARIYKEADGWRQIGEPTEAALVVAACKGGLHPEDPTHTITSFPLIPCASG